ncbi:MAG: hypothetical protein IKZ31_02510 [Lentisphaeria bacterium]|nr:hypothetical protein [Lentisphaeria bacterium]
MKILIFIVNIILAGVLVWEGVRFFSGTPELAVRTVRTKKNAANAGRNTVPAKKTTMTVDEAVQTIQRKNIFNITRCPDVVGGRGGSAAMALLGIYRIGDRCGAIIQNSSPRQVARSGPPWMRQAQQARRQIRSQQTFMQGDVMENGYVVSEIYDDRVVLTRGGGRLELRLELASRPISQARAAQAARAARPSAQQIQQRMQMQQMQMMRQLMQSTSAMQRQMSSGGNTRSSRSR